MVVVPLSQPAHDSAVPLSAPCSNSVSLVRIAAAGSLTASGVLLANGKRRAGLVLAVSGTTLAMLDQQETVRRWWNALPGYIAEVQEMLGRVQKALDSFAVQREKLHNILNK